MPIRPHFLLPKGMRGQHVAFKVSKEQLAKCDALATELRAKAEALNIVIAEFNRKIQPLAQAVAEAQADYNQTLEMAHTLTSKVAEVAQEEFEAKSEKWQESEKGIQIRSWIEQWEMILDDIEFDLPEPLEEIDPEEHAGELEDATARPAEFEHALLQ
jgi:hypothetical protein